MYVTVSQWAQSSGGVGGRGGSASARAVAGGAFTSRDAKARLLRSARRRAQAAQSEFSIEAGRRLTKNPGALNRAADVSTRADSRVQRIRSMNTIGGRKPERYATAFNF